MSERLRPILELVDALDLDAAELSALRESLAERANEAGRTHDRSQRDMSATLATMSPLLEHMPVPVVIYETPDFRIGMANAAFRDLFGGQELLGRPLAEVYPGASTVLSMLEEACRSAEPQTRREYVVRRKNAAGRIEEHYFTSWCQPLVDDQGRVTSVIAVGFDVSKEVRARAIIAESAERMRVVLDELPVGVDVRDATTGELKMSNKASAQILGVDVRDHAHPDSWQVWETRFADGQLVGNDEHAFRRAMISGEPVRNQIVVLRRAGTQEERIVRSSAVPVTWESSSNLIVSVFDDVTDEHRLLREREQTARFAETFVGILGHDLRNPLNAITMASSLLQQASLNGADLKRARQIAASADRMAKMVNQLLDLTRARMAQGIPIERSSMDLVATILSVRDELAAAHPKVRFLSDLPDVMVGEWDRDRLGQVVSNLLSNAIEHGDPAEPIHIALTADANKVFFSVQNHGSPIPSAILPRLFDPFRRGAVTPNARSKGLGLGLYIAREIVLGHGGSIDVTQNDGTTFVVTLPRFLEAAAKKT